MKMYVVRHGETDWNSIGKLQGQTDVELNDTGRNQALQTSNLIKDEKIDFIFSSPLKRTLETASIINKNFNVPIIKEKRLIERCWGRSEGLTKAEIKEMIKVNPLLGEFWNYNKNIKSNDVECVQDFCKRVYEFLDEVKEKYKDKTILLVTHGGVSRPIESYCMHRSIETVNETKGLKNCEIKKYEI